MKLSYLVTVHNETDTLAKLLERLINHRFDGDEIIILDDFSDNEVTKKILKETNGVKNLRSLRARHKRRQDRFEGR